jgi:hypothetical protein
MGGGGDKVSGWWIGQLESERGGCEEEMQGAQC